jgi:hypothetical protein
MEAQVCLLTAFSGLQQDQIRMIDEAGAVTHELTDLILILQVPVEQVPRELTPEASSQQRSYLDVLRLWKKITKHLLYGVVRTQTQRTN